jgi:uncharacterized protein (DUF2141 family)
MYEIEERDMRKNLYIFGFLWGLSLIFVFPEARGDDLRIIFENVDPGKGYLFVTVVEGEEDWKALLGGEETKHELKGGRIEVGEEKRQEVVIEGLEGLGLEEGRYGVMAYQDVDGNGKLDRGFFGIPKEPLGFSNDAPIVFGPPKFKDAKLKLQKGERETTINLD